MSFYFVIDDVMLSYVEVSEKKGCGMVTASPKNCFTRRFTYLHLVLVLLLRLLSYLLLSYLLLAYQNRI